MGLVPPAGGEVRYRGEPTRSTPTHKLVRDGLVLVPEGRIVFANLTVQENLEMGAYSRRDGGVASDFEKVYTLFPRLKERLKQTAGTLSGGEQQMLAIGRALMSKPQRPAARRAVARPRADRRPRDLRGDRRDPPRRRPGAARRAERERRAPALQARVRARDGARGARGDLGGSGVEPEGERGVPGRVSPQYAVRLGSLPLPAATPTAYAFSIALGITGSSPENFASHSRRSARSLSISALYSSAE